LIDWGVHFEDAELEQLCTAVVAGDAAGAWLWAQTSAASAS
jgi:hypothetical protein